MRRDREKDTAGESEDQEVIVVIGRDVLGKSRDAWKGFLKDIFL